MVDPTRPRRAPRLDPRLVALAEESGYRIGPRIASGGMGIVYRATDADGRDVAVKLLRPEIADDPRARERLAREVTSQQRVRNPAIARILDAELDSAEAFVATEFIPGPTLEDAVREHGGLHPEMVREIGVALGECLRDIHAAGVVHRDLKPSNVLLRDAREEDLRRYDPEGVGLDPVIIDFGIAQAAEESRLTSTGLVMGTAAYLDPEVVRSNATGTASDWWAWAALIAFTATGREPFGSGRADLVFLRAERGELDVEGLPTELATWLRDALRARPEERADPEELLRRLDALDLTRYDDAGATEAFGTGSGTGSGAGSRPGTGRGSTAVLPVGGAGSTAALPGGGRGDTQGGAGERGSAPAEPTELLGRVGDDVDDIDDFGQEGPAGSERWEGADRTEALDGAEFFSREAPADRTELLGAGAGAGEWADGGAGEERASGRWEPRDPADDRTEAIPRIEDDPAVRTRALPVIEDEPSRRTSRTPSDAPDPARQEGPPTEVFAAVRPETAVLPVVRDPQPQPTPRQFPPVAQQLPPRQYPQWQETGPQRSASPPVDPVLSPQHPGGAVATPGGYPQVPAGYPYLMPSRPPRRTLLVWLGHAALIGVAAVAPYVALALLVVLGAVARTWDRSWRALERGRLRGARGGAAWGVGLAAPFRLLLGALEIALTALFPVILGLLVAISADAIASYLGHAPLPSSLLCAGAFAIALLLTWVGIGGRTTRDGAHRMLAAAAPDGLWSLVLGALLVLLIVAVVATALTRGLAVDYFPFGDGPRLESVLPWRG